MFWTQAILLLRTNFLRFLSENKLKLSLLAVTVAFEAANIILILMDENGQAIEKLTVHISEVAMSHIGAYIGAALGSLLPGVGNFVLGILGGILGGFIGKSIGDLIISLFPKVTPGEGPPSSEYFPFIYGSNLCFGEPLSQYNLKSILGITQSDYDERFRNVAFGPPSTTSDIYCKNFSSKKNKHL